MALLQKDGKTVEVIDPAAIRLRADGWEDADAEQTKAYYATGTGDGSHIAKVKASEEAGLDPHQTQPAQPHHNSPQVTPARQAELDAKAIRERDEATNEADRDLTDVDPGGDTDTTENREFGGDIKAQGDDLSTTKKGAKVKKNPTPTPVNDFEGTDLTAGPKDGKPVEDTDAK